MRIATWNCYRGECLKRAAELEPLGPDIAVIQECARPKGRPRGRRFVWFGTNPAHGVGVVGRAPFRVEPGPIDSAFDHTAFPAIVSGPTTFHLLAIWALPRPSYVRALLDALDTYRGFLLAAPTIIVGDFNCFARWSGRAPSTRHVELARRLEEDFRVVSAYHVAPQYDDSAPEKPTYFWRWKEDQPFHIDYCFVPNAWKDAVTSVHVGAFSEQQWRSDHRPVIVDLNVSSGSVAT